MNGGLESVKVPKAVPLSLSINRGASLILLFNLLALLGNGRLLFLTILGFGKQ